MIVIHVVLNVQLHSFNNQSKVALLLRPLLTIAKTKPNQTAAVECLASHLA